MVEDQDLEVWVLEEDINMAFKFKVKKRPNMAEAVASAFALGAVQGGTTALQNAMKEREERKKQQKILDQELRTKSISFKLQTEKYSSKERPLTYSISK